MELAVGEIISGKVTGITKFGAFVSLPEGKSGLVHISEVDQSYVSDIRDHLTEGQEVKVKVIAIDDNGRVNLSIKRTQPRQNSNGEQRSFRRSNQNGTHSNGNGTGGYQRRAGSSNGGKKFQQRQPGGYAGQREPHGGFAPQYGQKERFPPPQIITQSKQQCRVSKSNFGKAALSCLLFLYR